MSGSDELDFGQQTEQSDDSLPPLSDYGQRFVQNIPEEHRPIADKWVREWDAGVEKLRGKYENELGTYKKLGDLEDIQAGVQLYKLLIDEPHTVAEWLAKEKGIYVAPPEQQNAPAGKQPAGQQEGDPYEERFKKLEQGIVMTAQQQREFFAQQEQQRALAEYNSLLQQAEAKHGPFDKNYVSYLLSQGLAQTLDEAVEAFHKLNPGQQRRATAPNLLGASGNAPLNGGKKIDYGSLSEKDVTRLIAHRLEQAREANG